MTETDVELAFTAGNAVFFVSVNGDDLQAAPTPDGSGESTVEVTLEPGLNTVCVHAVDGAGAMLPEARDCVLVASVPE